MRLAYAAILATSLLACTDGTVGPTDEGADIATGDAKEDGTIGIEVTSRLRPGDVDVNLTTAVSRRGYVVYVGEDAKLGLEITRTGTQSGLDTVVKVYGPRLSDGSYPKLVAQDDDAGYGKLSKLTGVAVPIPGFYLVEVTTAAPTNAKARLRLSCTGSCDTELPIAPLGLDIKWFQRAAERRALSLQAYQTATRALDAIETLPANWGVVLDIDETTLDNSPYQRERADLGLGYSPATWGTWVDRRAAKPLPGVEAYLDRVHELGGKVVFVTNRVAATECDDTAANLASEGIAYEGIHCKTGPSDKNPRFEAIAATMTIVQFVGDNITDFPQLSQELRTQPETAYEAFGERFFIVPNPMYGSWEKNAD